MPKTVNEIKETLDIEATRAVESGLITDRQSMKKWLLDLGLEVTRETKKSLSIKNPNDDEKARPIRLTGAIYEQDFRLTETSQQLTIAASERYRREAEQRNQSDIQRYAEYSAKRSTELEQQYRQHQNVYTAETERSNERDITADRPDYSSNQEAAATRHDSPIARTTTADQTATSELAAVEQLEPRNSPSSQIKENPYYIEYSLDFTGMYNAYQQYLSGIRQQEQVQRHHRDGEQSPVAKKPRGEPEYSEVWDREKMGLVRPDRPESAAVQQQYANSAGNQLNESRSTVIADYRRSTIAIEEQQQKQQKALELIQAQSMTIEQLKSYTQTLNERHSEAVKIVQKYQQIVQNLSEQTISPNFSQKLHENLESQLQEHLSELVMSLNIDSEVKQIIRKELPPLALNEIEKQIKPLTEQIIKKMDSVEQYQGKLADLIQEVSSRL